MHLTDDEGWRLEIPDLPELNISELRISKQLHKSLLGVNLQLHQEGCQQRSASPQWCAGSHGLSLWGRRSPSGNLDRVSRV